MKNKAACIVDAMMDKDLFSQWLGIEILQRGQGHCRLRMIPRPEMCNGFGIVHGGISFSFADSALAFACNSQGRHAVSIECSISHIRPLQPGDALIAIAEEKNLGNRTAIYEVKVEKENGELVALFKGTVFRKDKEWEVDL
jgi:acyl-CoA thioesterase